jgi:amino acid transporter
MTELRRELSLRDLVLLNIMATLGVQWIAASAHVGPLSIVLHLSAAALFFAPSAVVVASLSRRFPEEGGFYLWTKEAFGEGHAFICGWCWWVSVLLYLPGLLMAGAGMLSYVAGERFASDTRIVVPLTLTVLWIVVGANILGMRAGKWLNNTGAVLTYAGGATVLAAAVGAYLREGSATPLAMNYALDRDKLSLWAQIAFAYTGLELGTLLAGEVRNPRRTVPLAAWISATAVAGAYVLGTISLMLVLPPDRIHPMTGLVQASSVAGDLIGSPHLDVLTAVLLFAGILGRLSTWAGGASRLPYAVGIDGAMPAAFARLHPRWRTPYIALIVQGVACSVFIALTQAGDTVRAGWQALIDMAVIGSFVPFIYIFLSAWKFGLRWSPASGLAVTLAAIALSLVPPAGVSSVWLFELKVAGGSLVIAAAGLLLYRRRPASGSSRRA